MTAKGGDVSVCEWYRRVYKSLCPISWVGASWGPWDARVGWGFCQGRMVTWWGLFCEGQREDKASHRPWMHLCFFLELPAFPPFTRPLNQPGSQPRQPDPSHPGALQVHALSLWSSSAFGVLSFLYMNISKCV